MIEVLSVMLDVRLKDIELPFLRGALISKVSNSGTLFHGHLPDGLRYSYPLIQYKKLGEYATVVALQEAVPQLAELLLENTVPIKLRLGRRLVCASVSDVFRQNIDMSVSTAMRTFEISRWLPLNQENYDAYCTMDSLADKLAFLENLLLGNILSFAKGVGVFFEEQVRVSIVYILSTGTFKYKGVEMLGFDIQFRTNVRLPEFIGLGKGVSLGFGTIMSEDQ